MKKILFIVFIFSYFFSENIFAENILDPGDIVIITVNSDAVYPGGTNSNGFDFVSRVDLEDNTQIYFTDKGWDGSLSTPFWRSGGEGVIRYTVPIGGISAGTIIHYDDSFIPTLPSSGTGMWDMYSISSTGTLILSNNISNGFDLASSGDNILVFQGDGANPQFLYGIALAIGTPWINTGTPSTNNSYIPSDISIASKTIVSLGNQDNYQYNCSSLGLYSSFFLGDIANQLNWNINDSNPYGISSCIFSIEKPEILSIERHIPLNTPTNTGSLSFRASFSGSVNEVDISDFTFASGSLTGSISSVQTILSGSIYNIIVNGFSGEGFINLDITSLSGITNNFGNPLLSLIPSLLDESYTIDNTKPVIILNGSGNIDVVKGYSYTDLGATCSDNYDSSCNVVNSGSVDTNTLGIYTITYNATDTAGNKADEITRTISVISGNTPVITLIGTGTVNHEVKTIYTDSGTTANDTEDGDLTANIIASGSVDTNTLGIYTITYDAIDSSGNQAIQVSRTINVIDTTKPIITLNGNSTQNIIIGNTYSDLGATCSDNYDSSCSVVSSGSVDTNTLGSYIITYNATDNSGNNANEITRTINVINDNSPKSSGGGGSGGGTPKIDYTKGLKLKISSFTENDDNNSNDNSEENFDENTIVSSFESCFVINALNDENFSFSGGIFSDINESQYKDLINKFVSLQIINGNTNGLFEPKRATTRAEFVKMVLLSHCYSYKDEDTTGLVFTDIENTSWQARVIIKAQNLGIIVGDINEKGDKVFRPNDTISKSEALKILIKTASIRLDTLQNPNNNFSDNDWYQKYIEIVKSLGTFENDKNIFLEEEGVNREDMIFMIYNIINLYK